MGKANKHRVAVVRAVSNKGMVQECCYPRADRVRGAKSQGATTPNRATSHPPELPRARTVSSKIKIAGKCHSATKHQRIVLLQKQI